MSKLIIFIITFVLAWTPALAASSGWIQTDWSKGVGPSTTDQYSAVSNIDTLTAGQITLNTTDNWFDSDWKHRQAVTIANSGAVQTDYQVRVVIPYQPGMQPDFDDIRFANENGQELDCWIHTKTDSTEAIVWVEVDDLAAADDTIIYIYFGNDLASSTSNGENTFLFFDGFDDNTIDPVKWTVVDPNSEISETGGELVFARLTNGSWNKGVYANPTFARSDLSFEFDYQWTINNPAYDAIMFGWHDSGSGISYTSLVYAFYNHGSGAASTVNATVYEDGTSRAGVTGQWTVNTDYDVRVEMRSGGGAFYEQSEDGGNTWSTSYTSAYSTESDLRPGWAFHSGTHHFDNARIRKWMDAEPTVTLGTIENRYTSTGYLISNIFETHDAGSLWRTITYSVEGEGTTDVKVRTSDNEAMSGAPDFSTCNTISSGADLSDNNCVSDGHTYVQYSIELTIENINTPVFKEISIEYDDAAVVANAGPDQTMTAGKSIQIDGSASAGQELSYNWALIRGEGSLTNIQSATPTYTIDDQTTNQDVEILLTVRNIMGQVDTDQLIIHIFGDKFGQKVSDGIIGEINGTIIYESKDDEATLIKIGETNLILPEDSGEYTINSTSLNQIIVGVPNANQSTGEIYLSTQPFGELWGSINLNEATAKGATSSKKSGAATAFIVAHGNQTGDRFGQYLATGDVNGDGIEEILIGAPKASDSGLVYIYDSELNLLGTLVGTEEYPLSSLFIGNYLSTGSNSVTFGPCNPAQNLNLTIDTLEEIEPIGFAFMLYSSRYFEGVTVLDAAVREATTGAGSSYQSLSLSDLNSDGHSDLILASNEGLAYIYFGQQSAHTNLSVSDANVIISGGLDTDLFGHTVATGDVTGDGLIDVIIGAPHHGENQEGALFVLFGEERWNSSIDIATNGHVLALLGDDPEDKIGADLLLADANSDGIKEIYTIKRTNEVIKFDLMDNNVNPNNGYHMGGGGCKSQIVPARRDNSSIILFAALLGLLSLLRYIIYYYRHRDNCYCHKG